MRDFSGLPDLASSRLGGAVVGVNDEFFAPAANLLQPTAPEFREGEYTDRGKWMDGWETRRRREPGHDWCVIRLGLPGVVRAITVDTTHFEGNYPDSYSLEGCFLSDEEGETESWPWFELSPKTSLEGDTPNEFDIGPTPLVSHIRLNIHPDGGVARLRVHGYPIPDWAHAGADQIDLASHAAGGLVVDCSDKFFSSPSNLLLPSEARGMWDGWETRRRRGEGHDWVVVKLGAHSKLSHLTVDTSFFKGNAPGSCSVEGALAVEGEEVPWVAILSESALKADSVNEFALSDEPGPFSHVRLNIMPDGGVARLRVLGSIDDAELERRSVQRFNLLPLEAATSELLACCESGVWAARVAGERPMASLEELIKVSDEAWEEAGPEEWLAAADSHPRIGERFEDAKTSRFRLFSAREQAAAGDGDTETIRRLLDGQQAYEHQFGHRFIVFASGKSASEILEILEERLSNDAEAETLITGEELAKITRLRLNRLIVAEAA